MITAWLAKLWAKVCTWLAFAGAVVLAIVSVGLYERKQGAKQQADADKADASQSLADAAQEVVKRANDAQEIENAIAKQPDAGTQKVGTAKPGTSAGELREHWMRPDATQDDHAPPDHG